MPAEPLYKKYPELYSYDTETQRHILKSSKVFKRLFKESPQIFVDSQTIIPARSEPIKLPLPPAPEVPSPAVHIGAPLPEPPKPQEQGMDQMRIRIQELIKEELKANPKPYENKNANELSKSFRAMLIERLAPKSKPHSSINNKSNPKPTPKKSMFKLREPVVSENDDYDI